MAAKFTRLTHKIAIQLHLWQRDVIFAVLAPGGRSGNFWVHPHRQFSSCVYYYGPPRRIYPRPQYCLMIASFSASVTAL